MKKHVVILKSRAGHCGGLEKYSARIAAAFAEKGARVSLLGGESVAKWPSFLRLEQYDRYVQTWLKNNPADLVFGMDRNRHQTHLRAGNGVHAAYLKSRIAAEGRLKYLICRFNPLHRKILELEQAGFENPALQKLFTNSHMVRSEILNYYKVDPKKIKVIHNGVEWEEMADAFQNWENKREMGFKKFGLDPSHFHFLFVGNGYLRKGLDRLLEGLSRLSTRDFHLSVVGKDKRMELYRAKAMQLGLKTQVRFFGAQSEIRLFYQMADVLVIPSFYDPFANVTVEALAMGLFVLSSKQNGGAEILTKENGAVIEDLLEPDSMVNALELTLKERKTPMSAAARRQSVASLDFSKQMRTLIEACE
ncbi:MAG TPA: glycosyltransferase family 4 protein [Chlamydiales bacterium]|nr:glycosyltransferase family 4 protein [Chlamydiales bacterium]